MKHWLSICEERGHDEAAQQNERHPGARQSLCKIWIEQCEAARGIENEFGTQKALAYLVQEKFLNYLEAAENEPTFEAEIPAFVAEIKRIFEPWQLAECLDNARQTEPFDPSIYENDDPEIIEMIEEQRFLDLLQDKRLIDAVNDPALAAQVRSFDFQKALDYAMKR